jgi:signal transduction histidine kinase
MFKYLIIFFISCIPTISVAGNPIVFSNKNEILNIRESNIEILEDKENILSFSNVISSPDFKLNMVNVPNFGVSKSTFWLKFEIKNNSSYDNLLLNLDYPNLDEVELYTETKNKEFFVIKMGKHLPFFQRNYQYPSYIFDLKIPFNKIGIYYLKVRSGGQILTPIFVGVPKKVLANLKTENFIIGIYCGIFLIMFFYNLFIYFTVRDKVYLFYIVYIVIVGLVQLCLLGYTFQYLWPNSSWLAIHGIYLLSALVGISSIEFFKVFLQTKIITPSLHKGFIILNTVYLIYIILDLFNLASGLYNIIQLCAMILSFYMIFVAVRISKTGSRQARFFLIAWSSFLVGVFVYALKDVGLLPYNNFTIYLMPIGTVIEITLLSFALADRINTYRKEKEQSQAQTLNALKENERIIKEQNITLEKKVKERTAELETSNKNLKDAEVNLVNAEKMAGLGQLTAGIAHEINNPINFVVANIAPLKRDISEVLLILDKYNDIKDGENLSEKLKEINDLKKKLDIDYVSEEINLLLKGIDEGAGRTSEIVKGLQNFSRTDEGDLKLTDIHEGINSTLNLLNSNLKDFGINVVKDYGTIPNIECFPGKLNQVFMNLLNNSIHAIKSLNNPLHQGEISIKTYLEESNVCIQITDNGIGISQKNLSKVFEPFFTTKDIGQGTGLGLSIVYGIIKAHKGTIEVSSFENKSTTFLIKIPLAQ